MALGMLVNMKYCTGCDACTMACKESHGNPAGVFFTHLDVKEEGTFPDAREIRRPVACNHCDAAPCVEACKFDATHKYDNGVVAVDHEKCTGCEECVAACPYGARTYIGSPEGYFDGSLTAQEAAMYAALVEKTTYKCDWCAARRAAGEDPACVQTCPAQARFFGDVDDPESAIGKELERWKDELETLPAADQTKPRLYYVKA